MKRNITLWQLTALSALVLLFFACAQRQVRDDEAKEPGSSAQTGTTEGIQEGRLEESDIDTSAFREVPESDPALRAVFADIQFDYDDFSLKPSAQETLRGIAEWMIENTSSQVLIEGHCDERGTNEYNLALGERRANSAKKYLVQLGVDRTRIATISYGEERPLDPRSTEEAWKKNRRGHFLIR